MENNTYQEQFYIFSKEKTAKIVKDFIKNNSNKIYDLFELENNGLQESLEDYEICQDIFENQLFKKPYEVIEKDNKVTITNNLLNCLLNIKPEKSNISKSQAKNTIENFLNSKNIAGEIDDFFIISRTYLRKMISQFVGAINYDLKNYNIINVFKLREQITNTPLEKMAKEMFLAQIFTIFIHNTDSLFNVIIKGKLSMFHNNHSHFSDMGKTVKKDNNLFKKLLTTAFNLNNNYMTFLTKPSELKSPTAIKELILGDTNNGKTTLALSAPEPILKYKK